MKNCLLILLGIFLAGHCAAQDTVAQRNRLSDSVVEHFFVLKSNPQVKEGPYTAILRHRTLIARGKYKNNKKAGPWQFFDTKGKMVERYNYDTKKFGYEAPMSESDNFNYLFDENLKPGDRVTRPLKVGGIYYGYINYLNIFQVPFDTGDVNTYDFEANIELLISPLGRLADYKIRLTSPDYDYNHVFNMDISLFSEEDRTFTPATLNGVPVLSRIVIRCYVSPLGKVDFYSDVVRSGWRQIASKITWF